MKRLIAAVLTATTMTLASCTATTATDPNTSAAPGTSTAAPVSTGPTATGPTTPDPIESWLTGTTTTGPLHTSTSTTGSTGSSTVTSTAATGDAYDAIPVKIPATITGADLKIANQAVSVWRNAMRVLDQSLQRPDSKNWKPFVYQYINDPAALKQMSLINTFIKQGIHQVGETGYTAEVFEADKNDVKIRACVDLSRVDYIDANGNSQLVSAERHVEWEFWLGLYSEPKDVWFVGLINKPDPVKPCGS